MDLSKSLKRTAIYAGVGLTAEVAFSALHDLIRGNKPRLRTSLLMLPVYALITPLFEPFHGSIRSRPAPQRAALYGVGFLAAEYASGSVFRRLLGEAPWDYSYASFHVSGLIRPDYFILWAMAGLALERLHDELEASDVAEQANGMRLPTGDGDRGTSALFV